MLYKNFKQKILVGVTEDEKNIRLNVNALQVFILIRGTSITNVCR